MLTEGSASRSVSCCRSRTDVRTNLETPVYCLLLSRALGDGNSSEGPHIGKFGTYASAVVVHAVEAMVVRVDVRCARYMLRIA
jgi:hypothetical protein